MPTKFELLADYPKAEKEEDRLSQTMLFYVILLGSGALFFLLIPLLYFFGWMFGTIVIFGQLVALIVSYLLMKKGWIQLPSFIVLGSLLVALLVASYFGDGVKDIMNAVLVFSIVISVNLLKKKLYFLYTAITLLLFSVSTYFSQINIQHLPHNRDYWTNIAVLDTILIVIIVASYKFNTMVMANAAMLRKDRKRFELLTGNIAVGIVTFNETNLTYANDFMETITGYTRAELFSLPFIEIVHPDDREQMQKRLAMSLQSENIYVGHEYRIIRKGGEVRWVYISSGFTGSGESFMGVSGIIDIHRLKELEARTLRMKKTESIGLFAEGLSHDLNNYMAGILGSVDLLQIYLNDYKDERIERSLVRLKESAKRIGDIMKQMIYISRGGVLQTNNGIGIRAVIERVIGVFRSLYPNINIRMSIAEDLKDIPVASDEVEKILKYIMDNSIEAIDKKTGVIKISAANITLNGGRVINSENVFQEDSLEGGTYILVSIMDNGKGIPLEKLSRVLDPYYTTNTVKKGMGLSLALSIMRLHGGTLTIQSTEGKGTTVNLYFPA